MDLFALWVDGVVNKRYYWHGIGEIVWFVFIGKAGWNLFTKLLEWK